MKEIRKSYWLICPNSIEVRRFTHEKQNILNNSIYIDAGIVMGVHGDKPPLLKKREKVDIEKARKIWQKLINTGWQTTTPKWN